MTDEVGLLVLRDNYYQTQALSIAGRYAVELLDAEARLMRWLERAGRLNRVIEFLPTDDEVAERQAAKLGLTSPERAVLLAYSKMWLYDALLESDVPEDPLVAAMLVDYFPKPLQQRFSEPMRRHPLRREILATHLTNALVNRVGCAFVHRLMERPTRSPATSCGRASWRATCSTSMRCGAISTRSTTASPTTCRRACSSTSRGCWNARRCGSCGICSPARWPMVASPS